MDRILADSKIEYISMRPESTIKKPLVCRICMVEENLNSIFGNDNDSLAEKIRDCGKVEVTRNDGLPEFICTNCINKVDVCFELKLQIQASDTLLRKIYLGNYSSNNEKFSEEMGEPIEDSYYEDSVEQTNYDNNDIKIEVNPENRLCIDLARDVKDNVRQNGEANAHKKFTCEKCGKQFATKPKIAEHLQAEHSSNSQGPFECVVCYQKFKMKQSLRRHTRIVHEQKRYDCDQCELSYTSKFVLDLHQLEQHTMGEPIHECEFCQKKFRHERVLKNHKVKRHLERSRVKVVESRGSQEPKKYDRKLHMCHICGSSFKGKSRVLNHIKYVHSEKPLFECNLCPQAYKDKKGLTNHKLVVHENHRWECDQCEVSYTAKYMLSLHKLEKHSNLEATHQCDICKKVYKHAIFLKRHKKTHNVHRLAIQPATEATVQKEIKYNYCTACDKNFAYRKLFTEHKAEHDGKFECRICQKIFPTDRALTVHKSVIHDNPLLQCQTCEYNTTRPDLMKRHTKFVHDGFRFECEFCDKRFAKKKAADAHRITHTEGQAPDRDGFVIVPLHN